MHDAIERRAVELPGHDMHVVGHHAPRQQAIAFAVEVYQRVLDHARGFARQHAGAGPAIERGIPPRGAFAHVVRRGRHKLRRNGGEAEDDVLHVTAPVAVRNVAARAPTRVLHGVDPRDRRLPAGIVFFL